MNSADLMGKRVLVVGGGLTGASIARFLARCGVPFDLVDERPVSAELAALVTTGRIHERLDAPLACAQDVILLSPGVPRAHVAVQAALDHGVRVAGDIELFAGHVSVPVVAVTGSNGKSTVVAWLADLLVRLDVAAVACGNIGRPALDSLSEADDVDCHVLELSSYQLESTSSLAPHAAVVLNVSDDHLDRYDSIEDYAAVKRRVYARATHVLCNVDDAATLPESGATDRSGLTVVRFTSRLPVTGGATPDGPANPASTLPPGTRWHRAVHDGVSWLCRDGEPLLVESRLALPGQHNAANALVVLALLESLGLREASFAERDSRVRVVEALCAFRGLPHRTRLVGEADGIRWYDDSKGTNVDACVKAVEAMPGPVLLIAGGQSKGADFAPLRPVLATHARAVVLIGEDRMRLHAALDGAVPLHLADSLALAVDRCGRIAQPGDAVLLSPACASFDMFADFADRGRQFESLVAERLGAPPFADGPVPDEARAPAVSA